MIIVNPIYIDYIFGTLSGMADNGDDIDIYGVYNSDVEKDVKLLAKKILLPEFEKQNPLLREKVKDTLAYYLLFSKIDFADRIRSLLLPFKTPKNAKVFFIWIWEVLFEGNSYEYIKNETVVEDFDVNSPYNLLISPK